jgi:hypothetical protein
LDAFVDGELGPDVIVEVRQHLEDCARCHEFVRFTEALKNSTQKTVRQATQVSAGLELRIQQALAAERAREADEELGVADPFAGMRRSVWPLVAAAAAFVIFNHVRVTQSPKTTEGAAPSVLANASEIPDLPIDDMIDSLVDYHSVPPIPRVTEPALVPKFANDVGVRVSFPTLAQYGAEWQGGTVVPFPAGRRAPEQRAAYLRYRLSGHDVTVYVYDPARVPLHRRLERRLVVRDLPVYLGKRHNLWIAASEQEGVGYAIATDLNEMESAELVTALPGEVNFEGTAIH